MTDWISVVETIGIPAVVAVGMGYLVWTLFKNLIADIHKKLDTQHGMIVALIDRIRQMDNDMIRIDTLVRTAMDLPPDLDRIARSDGKKDTRRD
tara:strand:+ start:10216 stop:10497 length:282 start_codon:yes stop_codon:yes gene_type:complete